ncbi:winged helix-turn-helix transcriptional regulator [Phormidium sp. FACHB-592]|uniref:Winged helix-turn-helix transcriptional regulator n=1 Tax=Stenomitos frigidus AS-A4 TaxID=2933935 RepID=A0ABV0KF99_9CYAN|nr:winged helix-turn-helix transcriptional regulator [Phormidium sp. FACHB-592]MBD2076514.1 winged helix-turn-helix transcriptional regulator [Phormidium sp. FACHB-592]
MSHDDNSLKILEVLNSGKIRSAEIARIVGLSVETVRYYLQSLWDEGCIKCSEMGSNDGNTDYVCSLDNKGKAVLENPALLLASGRETTHQTIFQGNNSIGFVQSGSGTVSNFSQNIGRNLDEVTKLIDSLRTTAQSFPEGQREEALVTLDDLQEDLSRPDKQKPERIKIRLDRLLVIAVAIAGIIAGAADFGNNLLELAEKLGVPIEVPQLQPSQHLSAPTSEQQINLGAHGIDIVNAEILRANLTTFADDWNSPEMSVYDHYDAARENLKAR